MPQENVDIVRRAYAALAAHGFGATRVFAAGSTPSAMQWRGVYFEGQAFTAFGDKVVVDTKLHARGRATEIETEQRAFVVWTLREGLVTRAETFAERGQALAAVGLRE